MISDFPILSLLTGKYIILDVLARDDDGQCYNVEIQVRRYGAWHKRGQFYLARTLGLQLGAGEDYQELRASVACTCWTSTCSRRRKPNASKRSGASRGGINASQQCRWGTSCR